MPAKSGDVNGTAQELAKLDRLAADSSIAALRLEFNSVASVAAQGRAAEAAEIHRRFGAIWQGDPSGGPDRR